MATGVSARLTAREGRRFGFLVGGAFIALGALAAWRGHALTAVVLVCVGGLLGLAGLAVPTRMGPIYRGWMGFATALSKVTTPIFMGVVYFLLVAPVGLVRRALGRSPLRLPPHASSAWQKRDSHVRRSDLERQF